MYAMRSRPVIERSLGPSGTRIYTDDRNVTTLLTPRIERIARRVDAQLPRLVGHRLVKVE
jgi:hypothetical protein